MPTSPQLSIEALPAWAALQNVNLKQVGMRNVEGKGYGLVAQTDLNAPEDVLNVVEIMRIPAELVLSAEAVEEYAKVDQHFKQLLEAAGRKSTRLDIMIFLLVQMISGKHVGDPSRRCVSTAWSEYIKFLPRDIPVPTLWSEEKQEILLIGTSLEDSLLAKKIALENEFNKLRDESASLPFWNRLLWEDGGAKLSDWLLADAWYRSRCLELPQASHAMVPALDMVNHSATAATAYYEEDNSGDVSLRIRPGSNVAAGEELNISYGDKSAAEMLFSYGFIDPDSKTRQLTLHLDDFPDDPLALAKKRVFGGAPVVTFRQTERSGGDAGGVDSKSWESSFVYLMCLNEEDGLDFRILQDDAGNRQLRLFWQNEDVTERAGDMKALLQDHPLKPLFQLRAVSVVLECAADQLAELDAAPNDEQLRLLIFAGVADQSDVHMIKSLREIERSVIEAAVAELEEEKSRLVEHESVVAYFGSMEDDQNELAPNYTTAGPANEDVDFS